MGQKARVYYSEPNVDVDPWDCDYFAFPRPKLISEKDVELHDLRPEIFSESNPYKLETHGFPAVKHQSSLVSKHGSAVALKKLSEDIRDIYLPELFELVKQVTGCRKVLATNVGVRDGTAESAQDLMAQTTCGIPVDREKTDLTKPMIPSDVEMKIPPARAMHIDYSPDGVRQMIRNMRPSIIEEAKDIIAAEDEGRPARRYAWYSIWRPIKTVKRDPIIVLDPATYNPQEELIEFVNKQPSVLGDYLAGLYVLAPRATEGHKWRWISNQQNDEVLFIQFFDSYAAREGRPVGTPHGSPLLDGVDDEDPRESIEARVVAFW
jgi:hypothetical protein